ncbi:MAG: choice-of-anchor K domain-containing protein [Methanothrix sp.]|nr:choice-of-anchor K domain-containing protein [Methanothrix sp.]
MNKKTLVSLFVGIFFIAMAICYASDDSEEMNNTALLDNLSLINSAHPEDIKILPEQLSDDSLSVILIAVFNNSMPSFSIAGTEVLDNNLIIKVNCEISEQGRANLTPRTAYTTFFNLTCQNYNILVQDNSTGMEIARENSSIKPAGEFISKNGLTATIGTYKGGMENGTLYLMPFPTVPVCPPGLFENTSFWANTTDRFYLMINLTNFAQDRKETKIMLHSPLGDEIIITPSEIYLEDLKNNSSSLCVFQIENRGPDHGIYNLTYELSFSENGAQQSISGILPMGVYERYEYYYEDLNGNLTTNVKVRTPFNDTFNYTASGWSNNLTKDGKIWIPTETRFEASFGNYTMQEPHSPFHLALVGAVAGGVICGGATAWEQWKEKKSIDWNDVCKNAGKGAVGGAFLGLTYGFTAPGAIGAKLGLTGAKILSNTALSTVAFTALDAGNEFAEKGKISWSNVLTNAVLNAGESSILYGVGHIASAVTPAVLHAARGGGVGKWAKVSELMMKGKIIDSAQLYNSMAAHLSPQIFQRVISGYENTQGIFDLDKVLKSASFKYVAQHIFKDPNGEYLVKTNGEGGLFEGRDKSTDFTTTYPIGENVAQNYTSMICEASGVWTYADEVEHTTGLGSQEIRWGANEVEENSGLRFDASKMITADIEQDFCLGKLTHFNWPTDSGADAEKAILNVALHFTDPMVSPDPQFNFDLSILNTDNTGGACDQSIQKSDTPCDDLIMWTITEPTQNFQIGNEIYTLNIIGFVDNWPEGNPVNAFFTEERKTNTAYLIGRIIPHQVSKSAIQDQPLGQLPAKDLLYSEDFSNPKSGWPRYSTEDEVFAYEDGRYNVTVFPDSSYSLETHKDENFTDFVMEVEAAKVGGPDPSYYGLVFRYIDENNFYKFSISSKGEYKFSGIKDGSWFAVKDWTKSGIIRTVDASNIIQVVAEGGRFTFYINGFKVAYAFDGTFDTGRIGVVGQTDDGGAHVSFDNLKVWSIVPYQPFGSLLVGDILYSDEFSNSESGWANYTTEDVSYTYYGGRYYIKIIPKNAYFYASQAAEDFGDFVMEVEAAKAKGHDPVKYGAVLRFIDDNNFYRFDVSSNGYFKFDGKKDGSWFNVIDWTKSDAIYDDESTNIIQILAEGDKFTFYINGAKVAEAYDSSLGSGKIGLVAETSEDYGEALVSFDKLKVWSIKD